MKNLLLLAVFVGVSLTGCVSSRQYRIETSLLKQRLCALESSRDKMWDEIEKKAENPAIKKREFFKNTSDVYNDFESLAKEAAKETDTKFQDRMRELVDQEKLFMKKLGIQP